MKNERDDREIVPFRTIQLHPTRKCNLSCLHCYSSSGPAFTQMLDIDAIKRFLVYAREDGFNNIAVSGGEPFLYQHLEELFRFTRSIGYQNTLASNGILLPAARSQRILELVDLIAISIDGKPDLHNYIRGLKTAFNKMLTGVQVLKQLKIPFGFIHTITRDSWNSLLWLAEFAHEQGAKLLQLHPLEMHGRAADQLNHLSSDDCFGHQVYIMANYLQSKYAGRMVVQLDMLHRDYLEAFPRVVNTFERNCAASGTLSGFMDNLIVEETGRILPIAYGFNPSFAVGNVHDFSSDLFPSFIRDKVPALHALYRHTLTKVIADKNTDIVCWNELLVNESLRPALCV